MNANERAKPSKMPPGSREPEKSSILAKINESCSASYGLVSAVVFALPSLPEPLEESVKQLTDLQKHFITALWAKGKPNAGGIPKWASDMNESMVRSYMCGLPKSKKARSKLFQAGYRLGFVQGVLLSLFPSQGLALDPALLNFFQDCEFLKDAAAGVNKSPIAGRAELHAGIARGLERSLEPDTAMTALYLLLSTSWREVEKFPSFEKLREWVASKIGENRAGDCSRLTRLCNRHGLRLPDKG